MSNAFRTMVVPVAYVELARGAAAALSPTGGSGMFTTPLSPSGAFPATHYVSSGWIDGRFSTLMEDASALYAATQSVGVPVTAAQVQTLLDDSDVSEENPFTVFERMGLRIINEA